MDSKKIVGLLLAGFAVLAILYFLSQKKTPVSAGGAIPRPANSPGAGSAGSIPSIVASASSLLGRTVSGGSTSGSSGNAPGSFSSLTSDQQAILLASPGGVAGGFAGLSAAAQADFLNAGNTGTYGDVSGAPQIVGDVNPDIGGSVTALDTSAFPALDPNSFLA